MSESGSGSRDTGGTSTSRAMGQFSASVAAVEERVGTTIVGGQPPRRHRTKVLVPAGVEKILYLAAADSRFHEALLRDRSAAVAASGIELKESERAMLRAAPASRTMRASGW